MFAIQIDLDLDKIKADKEKAAKVEAEKAAKAKSEKGEKPQTRQPRQTSKSS